MTVASSMEAHISVATAVPDHALREPAGELGRMSDPSSETAQAALRVQWSEELGRQVGGGAGQAGSGQRIDSVDWNKFAKLPDAIDQGYPPDATAIPDSGNDTFPINQSKLTQPTHLADPAAPSPDLAAMRLHEQSGEVSRIVIVGEVPVSNVPFAKMEEHFGAGALSRFDSTPALAAAERASDHESAGVFGNSRSFRQNAPAASNLSRAGRADARSVSPHVSKQPNNRSTSQPAYHPTQPTFRHPSLVVLPGEPLPGGHASSLRVSAETVEASTAPGRSQVSAPGLGAVVTIPHTRLETGLTAVPAQARSAATREDDSGLATSRQLESVPRVSSGRRGSEADLGGGMRMVSPVEKTQTEARALMPSAPTSGDKVPPHTIGKVGNLIGSAVAGPDAAETLKAVLPMSRRSSGPDSDAGVDLPGRKSALEGGWGSEIAFSQESIQTVRGAELSFGSRPEPYAERSVTLLPASQLPAVSMRLPIGSDSWSGALSGRFGQNGVSQSVDAAHSGGTVATGKHESQVGSGERDNAVISANPAEVAIDLPVSRSGSAEVSDAVGDGLQTGPRTVVMPGAGGESGLIVQGSTLATVVPVQNRWSFAPEKSDGIGAPGKPEAVVPTTGEWSTSNAEARPAATAVSGSRPGESLGVELKSKAAASVGNSAGHSSAPAAAALTPGAPMAAQSVEAFSGALGTPAERSGSPSDAAPVQGGNPFEAMDMQTSPVLNAGALMTSSMPADSSGTVRGSRAEGTGGARLEVGYQDASLGYVELRAHVDAAGVHASLIPQSAASETVLTGHLGSLANWMEDRRTPVESLNVVAFDSGRSGLGHGGEGGRGGGEPGQGQPFGDTTVVGLEGGSDRNSSQSISANAELRSVARVPVGSSFSVLA